MTTITVAQLTEATLEGTGIFDVLMRANKEHLDSEFKQGRIKGPEYATVYLGSLTQVMQTALNFLLAKEKTSFEADMLVAQTALVLQQRLNAVTEGANLLKQGSLLEKQALQITQQTALTLQQTLNAEVENEVLTATKCKLQAEFDVLQSTNLKVQQETNLLAQKVATEKAQTQELGVDDNSVVGKQKALYGAQTSGFNRDAEQKAADILVKTWSVRRTTDEGTQANSTNQLDDATVGRMVSKLLSGVQA